MLAQFILLNLDSHRLGHNISRKLLKVASVRTELNTPDIKISDRSFNNKIYSLA